MYSVVIFLLGCLVSFHSVLLVTSEFVYKCTCKEFCSEKEINSTITCGQYVWCCNKTLEGSTDGGKEGSNDGGKSNETLRQDENKGDLSNEDGIDLSNDTSRKEQGDSDIDSQRDRNNNNSVDHDKTIHLHKTVGNFERPVASKSSVFRNDIQYSIYPTQNYPKEKRLVGYSNKLYNGATPFRLFVDRHKHHSHDSKQWFPNDHVMHKSVGSNQMSLKNKDRNRLGDMHHPIVTGEYQDALVWNLMRSEIRRSREPSYRHPFENGYGVTLDSRNENINFYFGNENRKRSKDISLIEFLDHQITLPPQIQFPTTKVDNKDMFSNRDNHVPLFIHKESVWTDYFRDLKLKRKREKEIEERYRQSSLYELFPLQQSSSVSMDNNMFPFNQVRSMNPWLKSKIIPKFQRQYRHSPREFGMKV
ncbi:unnamed protein product [Mytilus coruscus]|uniref:Uncharacterized protein n=1 Tax=Mytilus coruscus TaxID=42192 RepID=A0A6J8EEQ5_MYTCO|nr:unnamed protein product [Mytilus coruscus]